MKNAVKQLHCEVLKEQDEVGHYWVFMLEHSTKAMGCTTEEGKQVLLGVYPDSTFEEVPTEECIFCLLGQGGN